MGLDAGTGMAHSLVCSPEVSKLETCLYTFTFLFGKSPCFIARNLFQRSLQDDVSDWKDVLTQETFSALSLPVTKRQGQSFSKRKQGRNGSLEKIDVFISHCSKVWETDESSSVCERRLQKHHPTTCYN